MASAAAQQPPWLLPFAAHASPSRSHDDQLRAYIMPTLIPHLVPILMGLCLSLCLWWRLPLLLAAALSRHPPGPLGSSPTSSTFVGVSERLP